MGTIPESTQLPIKARAIRNDQETTTPADSSVTHDMTAAINIGRLTRVRVMR